MDNIKSGSRLYTNIFQRGNIFHVRGIDVESGSRFQYTTKYKPTLYTSSNQPTTFKTVHGNNVTPVLFDSVSSARSFIKENEDSTHFDVYGMDTFETQLITEHFPHNLSKFSTSNVIVYSIDIEVFSGINGPFPDTYKKIHTVQDNTKQIELVPQSLYPIPMISIKTWKNETVLFTSTPYTHNPHAPNVGELDVEVFHYKGEEDMLLGFLKWWNKNPPDILTGWNSTNFDMPYIINRIKRLSNNQKYIDLFEVSDGLYPRCNNSLYKKPKLENLLSPWGIINERTGEDKFKNKIKFYNIAGVSLLDYLEVYIKYTFETRTNYSLGAISIFELGVTKVAYNDATLNDFFINDIQKYTEYNIQDANLVHLLDVKLQFLNIVYTQTYMSKCNYENTMGTIRPWDALLYDMLTKRDMVVPLNIQKEKIRYPGAFVKSPKAGKYGFTGSIDLKSLYPQVIIQYNMGHETLIERQNLPQDILDNIDYDIRLEWVGDKKQNCIVHGLDELVNKKVNLNALKGHDICMAANGSFFRTDTISVLAEKLEEIYAARAYCKNNMNKLKAFKQEHIDTLSKTQLLKLNNKIDMLFGEQMAYKIFMNSLYGAMGTPYFRWYHNDIASAITISAQLALRWIMRKINELFNQILNTTDYDYVIYGDTDSITGDSTVYIDVPIDSNQVEPKGHRTINISELYESLVDDYFHQDDKGKNWTKKCDNHNTLSLNPETLQVESKPIKYVKKHTVYKEMFELCVDGVTLQITNDHSLIVLREYEIVTIKPSEAIDSDQFIKLLRT